MNETKEQQYKDYTFDVIFSAQTKQDIERCLLAIADNISHPRAQANKERSLNIKVTFKPDAEDTTEVAVGRQIRVNFAPLMSEAKHAVVDKSNSNTPKLVRAVFEQGGLFDADSQDEPEESNIVEYPAADKEEKNANNDTWDGEGTEPSYGASGNAWTGD